MIDTKKLKRLHNEKKLERSLMNLLWAWKKTPGEVFGKSAKIKGEFLHDLTFFERMLNKLPFINITNRVTKVRLDVDYGEESLDSFFAMKEQIKEVNKQRKKQMKK